MSMGIGAHTPSTLALASYVVLAFPVALFAWGADRVLRTIERATVAREENE